MINTRKAAETSTKCGIIHSRNHVWYFRCQTMSTSAIRGHFTSNSPLEPCGLFPNIKSFRSGKSSYSRHSKDWIMCQENWKEKKKHNEVIKSDPGHSVKSSLWHLYRASWSNYVYEWTTSNICPWVAQTTWTWKVQLWPSLSKAIMPPTTHFRLNNASFIDKYSSTSKQFQ